jgi:BlaI family penicillinase repressor
LLKNHHVRVRMQKSRPPDLSRRERQVMNALYAAEEATVSEIRDQMVDPPSYSSVRATLRVLEEKGHVEHEADGRRYLYRPTVEPERARRAALAEVVRTYFDGSAEDAAAALLRMSDSRLPQDAVNRLMAEIERTRKEGR